MPGSERQNNMFKQSPISAFKQKGNPFKVTVDALFDKVN